MVVVCGHGLVTLSLTINQTLKWRSSLPILTQVILVVTVYILSLSFPTSIPPSPILPVPNKPYGFCGR